MTRARRSRARAPAGTHPAWIHDIDDDARGVAQVDGRPVFIEGALPEERVTFRYRARHRHHDEAGVEAVEAPAPGRVNPPCPHFGVCGGCRLQHLDPARQVFLKERRLIAALERIGRVRPASLLSPVRGPHWGYRRRARLGARYVRAKGRVLVGFRERGGRFIADLSRCDVLAPPLGALIPALADVIGGLRLYQRIPQIEVAVGDAAAALVFRVLDEPGAADRAALAAFGRVNDIQIHLQGGGPETARPLWPEAPEPLYYDLPDSDVRVFFGPTDFIQVNARANRALVNRVLGLLEPAPDERVLDLFCGLGNFALPVARRGARVMGVEGDAALVDRAVANARANGLSGRASFMRGDLDRPGESAAWLDGGVDQVVVDPPRSGAWAVMEQVIRLRPHRVVYCSCHPATLARDAGLLVHAAGYRLVSAGVADLFPHTSHVEALAVFERG